MRALVVFVVALLCIPVVSLAAAGASPEIGFASAHPSAELEVAAPLAGDAAFPSGFPWELGAWTPASSSEVALGAAGSDEDADAAARVASSDEDETIAWSMRTCSFVYASVQVPFVLLEPYLSEGFEPIPLQGAVPTASVPIGINKCRDGRVGDVFVTAADYAQISVVATPPADFEQPGVSPFAYYHLFDVVLPDSERRDALAELGIGSTEGTIRQITTPNQGVRVAEVDWGDLGTVRVTSTGLCCSGGGGTFVDFAPRVDGTFAGFHVDFTVQGISLGAGVVSVPPGSWLADLLGGPVVPARVASGTWTYDPGHIFFP